jgi:4-hydroxybenzoyl-CoA thioesterase
MGWIDETAYACAVGWSSGGARAVYSGGIHFFRPIRIGHVVEVEARLIHTGAHSMHIAVHVRSGSPSTPGALEPTTQCLSIFVDPGSDGRARPVQPLELRSDEDRRLDRHARELIRLRNRLGALPLDTAPVDAAPLAAAG